MREDNVRAVVVSDLHLGSRHCLWEPFRARVQALPPDAALILNGDVVSRVHRPLSPDHAGVLALLRDESMVRPVVWVRGNHDERYTPDDPGRIVFAASHAIGRRLYIAHGYDFDALMPRNRLFITLFRLTHELRMRLGAPSVHVAYYAKKWPLLYGILRRHVARNAVEYARRNGFAAVTCGHTHYAEDVTVDGIRYLNTGSWTEQPTVCLVVTDNDLTLEPAGGAGAGPAAAATGTGRRKGRVSG